MMTEDDYMATMSLSRAIDMRHALTGIYTTADIGNSKKHKEVVIIAKILDKWIEDGFEYVEIHKTND